MTLKVDSSPLPAELSSLGVRPAIPAETRPFWDSTERGQLMVERCDECGLYVFPLRGVCRRCWSRGLSLIEVHPPGILYSWTVNYHPWTPGIRPYPIGIVELPEYQDIRFVAPIDGLVGEPTIGQKLGFGFGPAAALGGLHRLHFTPWPAA
jgi:uncharacterized protein